MENNSNELWVTIVGVIGTIGGGFITFLVQSMNRRHDLSKINNQRSDDLFEEYKLLADKLEKKVEALEQKVDRLEKEADEYKKSINFYRNEIERYQDLLDDSESENIELISKIDKLAFKYDQLLQEYEAYKKGEIL